MKYHLAAAKPTLPAQITTAISRPLKRKVGYEQESDDEDVENTRKKLKDTNLMEKDKSSDTTATTSKDSPMTY